LKKTNKLIKTAFVLFLTLFLSMTIIGTLDVSARGYTGTVTFQGEVTITPEIDGVPQTTIGLSGISVQLWKASIVFPFIGPFQKVKSTTTLGGDDLGEYSLSYYVQPGNLYELRVSRLAYNSQNRLVFPMNPIHTEDFTLNGKVALFMWANDIGESADDVINDYTDYLIEEEKFTNVLHRYEYLNWEGAIDNVDSLETFNSQVFIYILSHGEMIEPDNIWGFSFKEGDTLDSIAWHVRYGKVDPNTLEYVCIRSSALAEKIQCLESRNIFLAVEACYSGDFVWEFDEFYANDKVFVMSSTDDDPATLWIGENYEYCIYYPGPGDPPEENDPHGGVFSHYFFAGLALGKTDIQAFNYAVSMMPDYIEGGYNIGILSWEGLDEDQNPQYRDTVFNTWFDENYT